MLYCPAWHSTHDRPLGKFALDELEPGTGLPGRVQHTGWPLWISRVRPMAAVIATGVAVG